ncbi:OLC1v1023616C1 [Oldenlandia corymbosa var. corymbosa]|uniref:OLC1v1023616C1 n=1 Tax=Oldenlandia corymbosa var. corymbosa TaxID=529605 RepID=A0AAV1C212_OLDCO|nr:OLC1v1023616C1 [Oldenlandia corymbosa var. corymbosa]
MKYCLTVGEMISQHYRCRTPGEIIKEHYGDTEDDPSCGDDPRLDDLPDTLSFHGSDDEDEDDCVFESGFSKVKGEEEKGTTVALMEEVPGASPSKKFTALKYSVAGKMKRNMINDYSGPDDQLPSTFKINPKLSILMMVTTSILSFMCCMP